MGKNRNRNASHSAQNNEDQVNDQENQTQPESEEQFDTTDTGPEPQEQAPTFQEGGSTFTGVPHGEAQAEPVEKVAEPEQPTPVEVIVNKPVEVAAPADKAVAVEGVNPFTTPTARLAFAELDDYIRTLSVKSLPTTEQGAALQAGLHRALLGAINAPAEEFEAVLTHFLNVVHQHRDTIFSARYKFRWMTSLTMLPAAIDNFKLLVTLFTTLADPKSRGLALKQIDWQASLSYRGIKEESRQRVLNFFQV